MSFIIDASTLNEIREALKELRNQHMKDDGVSYLDDLFAKLPDPDTDVSLKPEASGGLVFTRREGQTVVIGDPKDPLGHVKVTSIRGEAVRILFQFPRSVTVHRGEVAEQIVTEAIATGGNPPCSDK